MWRSLLSRRAGNQGLDTGRAVDRQRGASQERENAREGRAWSLSSSTWSIRHIETTIFDPASEFLNFLYLVYLLYCFFTLVKTSSLLH